MFVEDTISSHLAKLFNKSVSKGKFPSCLKTARVIPISKSGLKLEVKNYRPISTLPFIGKLFELLNHSKLYEFFDRYKIFFEDQYGFLKNKSTHERYASIDGKKIHDFNLFSLYKNI